MRMAKRHKSNAQDRIATVVQIRWLIAATWCFPCLSSSPSSPSSSCSISSVPSVCTSSCGFNISGSASQLSFFSIRFGGLGKGGSQGFRVGGAAVTGCILDTCCIWSAAWRSRYRGICTLRIEVVMVRREAASSSAVLIGVEVLGQAGDRSRRVSTVADSNARGDLRRMCRPVLL